MTGKELWLNAFLQPFSQKQILKGTETKNPSLLKRVGNRTVPGAGMVIGTLPSPRQIYSFRTRAAMMNWRSSQARWPCASAPWWRG